MRHFGVKRADGGSWAFLTTDNWEGLWVPIRILGRSVEPDGHYPEHKQAHGTCQLRGESAVRRMARSYVREHEE